MHTNEFRSRATAGIRAGRGQGTAGLARYARPSTPDEALALLSEGEWRILAGGTDFYPAQGARPITEDILEINGIEELRGIRETDGHIVLGARTTWTDVLRHALPPAFDALKMAAREVGSVQIQNAGTVAGNLCNASPAADGMPALMILDAEVELSSMAGVRHLALADFILGNRRTARRPDELLTAIRIPKGSTTGASHFLKLGARRYLVISIAMAAVRIDLAEDGRIRRAAIAVGACSCISCSAVNCAAPAMTTTEKASVSNTFNPASVARMPNSDAKGMITRTKGAASARPFRKADFVVVMAMRSP
mgnify:CR=1 FL=1